MDGGFGRHGGEAIHHLERGGEHAGGDDVGDGLGGGGDGVECGEQNLDGFWALENAEGDAGGDAEGSLGADEDAGEVVAGGVGRRGAEGYEVAIGQHDVHAEDVGGGESVLEAVRSAGVFGDVAADGADGLRGGIGRVEVAVRGDRIGDVGVDDAGFDDDALVG